MAHRQPPSSLGHLQEPGEIRTFLLRRHHAGGGAKPLAHSLSFLRDCIDSGAESGGDLEIRDLEDPDFGLEYIYRSPSALFIGAMSYDSEDIAFETVNGKPANVMLQWNAERVRAMASNDALLKIRPGRFADSLRADAVRTEGFHGELSTEGGWMELKVLEGEVISIEADAALKGGQSRTEN